MSDLWSVADSGIDRRGARRFLQKIYTPQLALICSRGVRGHMLPRKIFKSET